MRFFVLPLVALELPGVSVTVSAAVVEAGTLLGRDAHSVPVLDSVRRTGTPRKTAFVSRLSATRVKRVVVSTGALALGTVRPHHAFRAVLHTCTVALRAIPMAAMTHALVAALLPHVTTLEAVPAEQTGAVFLLHTCAQLVVAHLSERTCAAVDALLVAVLLLVNQIATGSSTVASALEVLQSRLALDACSTMKPS